MLITSAVNSRITLSDEAEYVPKHRMLCEDKIHQVGFVVGIYISPDVGLTFHTEKGIRR